MPRASSTDSLQKMETQDMRMLNQSIDDSNEIQELYQRNIVTSFNMSRSDFLASILTNSNMTEEDPLLRKTQKKLQVGNMLLFELNNE